MRGLVALLLAGQLTFGCSESILLWSPPGNGDLLYRFERKGKVGFIDATGKIVIQPKLPKNTNGAFQNGLLSLGISSGPFIDKTGKRVIGTDLDRIWNFSEGLAAALKDSGSSPWGYIDHKGAWVISPRFPSYPAGLVSDFSEGLAVIETNGKVGYIDHTGQFVIAQQFVSAWAFWDGAARVAVSGPCTYGIPTLCDGPKVVPSTGSEYPDPLPKCRWSFIDKSGKRLFEADFEEATDFHEGLAAVKVAGKWGFVDKSGVIVISPRYESVEFFSEGLAFVHDGTIGGFIDSTGRMQFAVEKGELFSEGLAVVGDFERGFTYVDKSGRQAIPETFVLADRFFHGLAHVKITGGLGEEGEFAYIDRTGKRVFTYRGWK